MRALVIVMMAVATASAAPKGKPPRAAAPAAPAAPAPPPRPLTADDTQAVELLKKIEATPAAAKPLIDELTKLAPRAIDGLASYLARTHVASIVERRKVLEAIKAAVPDKAATS